MAESTEELEPLFDYTRVQPLGVVCLDDDDSPIPSPKRIKILSSSVDNKEEKNGEVVNVVDCEEEEDDWLPPPPKASGDAQKLVEDSTIKELRLKKQELVSFTQSAEDVLRTVEESAKRELAGSLQSSLESDGNKTSKPHSERVKIVISMQDKDGLKQFRIYMDDTFERLFKMYADKVKSDIQYLVFCFDGDKISPTATPIGLGMEDDDIIEVHTKSS
ncbi:uncharacterized protein LOC131153580 [Malania oleifera]|uniref:uncharacterized protein LOC131153580 n=1 Tax=Malania oleifera TaxID=397392 RepID=UPI0025AEA190|nr:uncharacterized protein LOC131153580 [Malania oleifera]XP_057961972.1 uncharacterized protein LOC131153580 [Malania oleifera]XP_057961973.1 uncharacterized protein LOC131153580 [Malania oleifera]